MKETVPGVFEPMLLAPNEITEEVSLEAEQAATERALTNHQNRQKNRSRAETLPRRDLRL